MKKTGKHTQTPRLPAQGATPPSCRLLGCSADTPQQRPGDLMHEESTPPNYKGTTTPGRRRRLLPMDCFTFTAAPGCDKQKGQSMITK